MIYLIETRGANVRIMSTLFYWSFKNYDAQSHRARASHLQNTRYRYRLNHTARSWCHAENADVVSRADAFSRELAPAREIARVNCTVYYRSRQFIMQLPLNRRGRSPKATIYCSSTTRNFLRIFAGGGSEMFGSITIRNLCSTTLNNAKHLFFFFPLHKPGNYIVSRMEIPDYLNINYGPSIVFSLLTFVAYIKIIIICALFAFFLSSQHHWNFRIERAFANGASLFSADGYKRRSFAAASHSCLASSIFGFSPLICAADEFLQTRE